MKENTASGLESEKLLEVVMKGMQEKKAEEIVKLDLREVQNSVSDFFIICHGNSGTHVEAITRSIEEESYKHNEKPWHIEGLNNSEWVCMDFVNVVAHIFYKPAREFYDLEGMWGDVEITKSLVE